MKVEFYTQELDDYDLDLVVPASEFLKAKNEPHEFKSLQNAVEAYCDLFCFTHILDQDEYNCIAQFAKNGDTIIFSANGIDSENEFTLDCYLNRKGTFLKIISTD